MNNSDGLSWDDCPIRSEPDLVLVRALMRQHGNLAGLGMVDLTKFITAGSELARNILKYAGAKGGQMRIAVISAGAKQGVRATFLDEGPGIADHQQALQDGYSSGGSLGLGLPGARRLSDEFTLESVPGRGTVVTIVRWKR